MAKRTKRRTEPGQGGQNMAKRTKPLQKDNPNPLQAGVLGSMTNNWKKPQVHRLFSGWRTLTIPDTCQKGKTAVLKESMRHQCNLSALMAISKELGCTKYLQRRKNSSKTEKLEADCTDYEMVGFRILGGEEETRSWTITLDFRRCLLLQRSA